MQFGLVLWNPNDPSLYHFHHAHHRFTKDEGDWGFTRFLEIRKMFNAPWDKSARPLVEDDAANISVFVRIVKDETGVLWHNFNVYDSKTETGFVGLKNQGATCYLNSLLQSLYFTNAFRKVWPRRVSSWVPSSLANRGASRRSTKFPRKTMRKCRIAHTHSRGCSTSCRRHTPRSALPS